MRLIKRGKTESFNQSLGLFSMDIFKSDQEDVNQTLKRNSGIAKL